MAAVGEVVGEFSVQVPKLSVGGVGVFTLRLIAAVPADPRLGVAVRVPL